MRIAKKGAEIGAAAALLVLLNQPAEAQPRRRAPHIGAVGSAAPIPESHQIFPGPIVVRPGFRPPLRHYVSGGRVLIDDGFLLNGVLVTNDFLVGASYSNIRGFPSFYGIPGYIHDYSLYSVWYPAWLGPRPRFRSQIQAMQYYNRPDYGFGTFGVPKGFARYVRDGLDIVNDEGNVFFNQGGRQTIVMGDEEALRRETERADREGARADEAERRLHQYEIQEAERRGEERARRELAEQPPYFVEYVDVCDVEQYDNIATGYANYVLNLVRSKTQGKISKVARDGGYGMLEIRDENDNSLQTIRYDELIKRRATALEVVSFVNKQFRELGIDSAYYGAGTRFSARQCGQ